MKRQITDTIMMVRPSRFGYNAETAKNNAFQVNDTSLSPKKIMAKAKKEFDLFVSGLRQIGVNVIVMDDPVRPETPDAVFPNNWITTHESGSLITYPMYAPKRRKERNQKFIKQLASEFKVKKLIQMEYHEKANVFLEGTGSMIMDRPNDTVYACFSPRTHPQLLTHFCKTIGAKEMCFTAVDGNGQDIYHTNVMMALGQTFVVICLDTIQKKKEKKKLIKRFKKTEKEIIEISLSQMMSFAGNMLQVQSKDGTPYLVMSSQAYKSLKKKQIKQIKKHTEIFHSPIPVIETYGGGSARCMMAEIFLKAK